MQIHGFQVYSARDADTGASWAKNESFIAAVVDARNGSIYPADVVRVLRSSDSGIGVVFLVDSPTRGLVEDLKRLPGTDLISAPINVDELGLRVHRLAEARLLVREADHLRGERDLIYRTDGIVANSPQMQDLLKIIERTSSMSTMSC